MANDDLTVVYSSTDETDAEIVRLALEQEGISCAIENRHQAGFTGVFSVEIVVRSTEAERAKAFITDHEQRRDESADGS